MPISAPIIAALIGAATTATETGLQLSGALTPTAPKPTTPTATGPTTGQITAATAPQALSIESATGGSVSPDYLSTIAPILAGTAGQANTPGAIQQILDQILGKGKGTAPTSSPTGNFTPSGLPVNLSSLAATPGVSDFLTKIAGGLS